MVRVWHEIPVVRYLHDGKVWTFPVVESVGALPLESIRRMKTLEDLGAVKIGTSTLKFVENVGPRGQSYAE